ncbi:MAG: OmpA family protein [Paracoccus sp. (in: a-proteobacteria)]
MEEKPIEPEIRYYPRRRGRFAAFSLAAFVLAAAGSWFAAGRIADIIEARTEDEVRTALASEKQNWVSVSVDGLMVNLSGSAPGEVDRFRVLTLASTVVDSRRIQDQIKLDGRDFLEPPDFKLDLMRQGNATSLIGLLPERTDRKALATGLGSNGNKVTDLTTTAAFPPPPEWQNVLDFAVKAAGMFDQVTISATPNEVRVKANAPSVEEKGRLEAALQSSAPKDVRVTIAVSAPLPVISPYRLRFTRGAEGAALENCSAESDAARQAILTAAAKAGASDELDCAIGIGAPTGWTDAVRAGLETVARLGDGTLEISDDKMRLVVPASTSEADQKAETERLTEALPEKFSLRVERAEPPQIEGPARFTAHLPAQGPAEISGVVHDQTMRQTVQSLARAQLGPYEGELTLDPGLRDDWALRIMAGLDTIGLLDLGDVEVTPSLIGVKGVSGDRFANEKALIALANRLGEGADYSLAIAYDPRLDPEIVQPDGTACVDRLNAVMLQSRIGFEPGGAKIAGDIGPVIEQLRPIMAECSAFQIELAGHTDSQGGDDANMALSLERAEAVLTALREAELAIQNMTAQGYGETRPIAENDTQEGREANRRIEMTLISPDPVAAPEPVAEVMTGKTPSPEAASEALLSLLPPVSDPETETAIVSGPPLPPFMQDEPGGATVIEPPAEVLIAGPDTPRPQARPQSAEADADGSEPPEVESADAGASTDPEAVVTEIAQTGAAQTGAAPNPEAKMEPTEDISANPGEEAQQ